MDKPGKVTLNEEEVKVLEEHLSSGNLTEADRHVLKDILQFYRWLQWALQETKLSIHRLRSLFGFKKTEKSCNLPSFEECEALIEEDFDKKKDLEPSNDNIAPTPSETSEDKKKKGHGRLSHEAYTNAKVVEQKHESLRPGDPCPEDCGGKLYSIDSRPLVCIEGNSLLSATKYLLEQLRCALCGKVFTAHTDKKKYDESVGASIAIMKNYAGMPFKRMETLQNMVGVPMSDATQWDITDRLAQDVSPVYGVIVDMAAQGALIHHDDTTLRILSVIQENKSKSNKERKGTYTTGILSFVEGIIIALFMSGRQHSGENMTDLLNKRSRDAGMLMRMCDALSANLCVYFEALVLHCLAHARRKFYEIYDYFPKECGFVIAILAKVYHHDAMSKRKNMTPQERLIFHQTHSAPLLKKLKEWLILGLEEKRVEPNSSLGKAFLYMLKHWDRLTGFLRIEGAPLDNNIAERALKVPIRSRKSSLFYKTEYGAFVGSMMTSLIHTCVLAKENPHHYLIELQKNRKEVAKKPEEWLPWNYRATLDKKVFLQKAA